MQSHSNLLAKILAGSWQQSQPPIDFSAEELSWAAPLLLCSGAGALGWWRIHHTVLRDSPSAVELQQAYRFHSLQAARYELLIKQVLGLCRANGLDPVLVKGWAIARLYPEKGLRPFGDIDLCFPAEQYPTARALLGQDIKWNVADVHKEFATLDEDNADEMFARSQMVKLDDVDVRVLAPEDHFRVLCLHMLRHGAWRPLWLCDIAVALESRAADFNWEVCLGSDRRKADWVACTIGLARELLKARIDDALIAPRALSLPRWLVPTVLKQWERPCSADHQPPEVIMTSLRHPLRVPGALLKRWPNPIEATINLKGPFNEMPRLLFQIGEYFSRVRSFIERLEKAGQRQRG